MCSQGLATSFLWCCQGFLASLGFPGLPWVFPGGFHDFGLPLAAKPRVSIHEDEHEAEKEQFRFKVRALPRVSE